MAKKKNKKKRTSLYSNLYSFDDLNFMRSNLMRIENAQIDSDEQIEEDFFEKQYKEALAQLAARK